MLLGKLGSNRFGALVVASIAPLFAAHGGAAEAQLRFDTYPEFPSLPNPRRIVVADVDFDGTLDAVTQSSVGGLTLLLSLTNRTGPARVDLTDEGGMQDVVAGDVDGDGMIEIVALSAPDNAGGAGENYVRVYRGDGAGGFDLLSSHWIPAGATDLSAADLDSSGTVDLAIAYPSLGEVHVLRGYSNLFFGPTIRIALGWAPLAVIASDLDGDGAVDLAAVSNGATPALNGTCSVRLGNGNATFASATESMVGRYPTDLAAADLDGDGDRELLAANERGPSLSILRHDAPGVFTPLAPIPTPNRAVYVSTGDVDGDADADVLVSMPGFETTAGAFLLRNDGGLVFDAGTTYPIGLAPGSSEWTDLDGDGLDDAVITMGASSSVGILKAAPGGRFVARVVIPITPKPNFLVGGDLDRDGDEDLVVGHPPQNAISVHLNDGRGGYVAFASFPAARNPGELALGDLDGDGVLDLVALDSPSPRVRLYAGLGDGSFVEREASLPTGPRPYDVAIADFDGDGGMDLAVINSASPAALELFLNRRDGAFGFDKTTLALSSGVVRAVIASDVDGDGFADVAAADFVNGVVSVLFGRGDGTFENSIFANAFPAPNGLAATDMDRDGDLDLLVSNEATNRLTVSRNAGGRAFQTAESLPTASAPRQVRVADFDRDGIDDALAVSLRDGVASIARGNGVGFEPPQRFAIGSIVEDLIPVDTDRDGLTDLVAVDQGPGAIVVVRNSTHGPAVTSRFGTVNRGRGSIASVLFVNDSAGDARRRLTVNDGSPVSIFVDLPPAATSPSPFVLWSIGGEPAASDVRDLPRGIGRTSFPTSLTDPGTSLAKVLVNNIPRANAIALLGAPRFDRAPAPVQVKRIPSSRVPRATFTIQGLIFDPGTSGFRMSVTNAVVVTTQ